MGFSSEAIFIKPALNPEEIQPLLTALGFTDYIPNGETYFEQADSRDRHGVYLGEVNGASYLIYDGAYDMNGRNNHQLSDTEEKIVSCCPDREVLSIMNFESSNSYGYAYIKGGKMVRVKEGCHPMVISNHGDELPLEQAYYVKKEIVNDQEVFFTQNRFQEGELNQWTHDQIGGSVAFELVAMLINSSYNQDDLFYSKPTQYVPRHEFEDRANLLPNDVDVRALFEEHKTRLAEAMPTAEEEPAPQTTPSAPDPTPVETTAETTVPPQTDEPSPTKKPWWKFW